MRLLSTLLLSLFLPTALAAQTQGVSGINNYWLTPGGTPGGSSCKPLLFTTPGNLTMNASSVAGVSYVVLWSTCPCIACSAVPALGIASCLPPPSSACFASNQFLESPIVAACITFNFSGVTTAAGSGSITVPVPSVGSVPVKLSSQTIFFGGPPGCPPAPFFVLVSQAWDVGFI